jgi:DNA helicase HerA-like ATPase
MIKSNERVFITGRTGSGKTYLANFMTRNYPHLTVYDEKHVINLPNAKIITSLNDLATSGPGRYIFRPPVTVFDKSREKLLNDFFKIIYLTKNRIVWIDEIYAISPHSNTIIPYLQAIVTRGRERNIGIIALTQRPAFIPSFFMSEAEHYFVFKLQLEQDRKRIQQYIGNVNFQSLNPYEFFLLQCLRLQ